MIKLSQKGGIPPPPPPEFQPDHEVMVKMKVISKWEETADGTKEGNIQD